MRTKRSLAKILFLIVIIYTSYAVMSSLAEEIKLTTIIPAQIVGAEMEVGTYTGTSVSTTITLGRAFQPDIVIIMAHAPSTNYGRPIVCKTQAMGTNTKEANGPYSIGLIDALTTTGFTLGTNVAVNENGTVYSYIAIKTN